MALVVVARDAKVEIVADSTVISCLHRFLAVVTGVHKLILTLCMKLVYHGKGRIFASSQRTKLVMLLSGGCQEGIPAVHQIARHLRIWIRDGTQAGGALGAMQADGEKDFFVLLHSGHDLAVQVRLALIWLFHNLALGCAFALFLVLFVALLVAAVSSIAGFGIVLSFGCRRPPLLFF